MVVFKIRCEETRIIARRLCRDSDELLQLTHVGIILCSCHTFDCLGTIRNGRHDFVSMADFWIHDVLVLEVYRIGKALASCIFDVAISFRRRLVPFYI